MTGRTLLLIGIAAYALAYTVYGRYLSKLLKINPDHKTPAHTRSDGIDYVPTSAPVLFGHHFASIAGAGPIVGPVLGLCFGWGPVALWIILGCILIGAVHDFSALLVSIRNEGQTIGHIIEKYISYPGRQFFLLFCGAALILIVAIFALLIAKTFVASPAVATSSLLFIFLAMIFGLLYKNGTVSLLVGSSIFVPILFFGIYLGVKYPFDLVHLFHFSPKLTESMWVAVLLTYAFFASVLPVWLLLQPRDYLNSYLLYSLVLIGLFSILLVNPALHMPFFQGFHVPDPETGSNQWSLFPILFVIIACGACSGFHALVASGTTSKQISNESHALVIGYGAMIVEGILALVTLIAVAAFPPEKYFLLLRHGGAVHVFSSGLAELSNAIKIPLETGKTFIALTISAFMLTTLDTATRLTRFIIHELAMPKINRTSQPNIITKILRNRYGATAIVVVLSGYLAISGDAGKIWPVFGASNQLLAALTLLVLTVIFMIEKRPVWVVFLPFVGMITISGWALTELFILNWRSHQWALCFTSGILLIQAVAMTIHVTLKIVLQKKNSFHAKLSS